MEVYSTMYAVMYEVDGAKHWHKVQWIKCVSWNVDRMLDRGDLVYGVNYIVVYIKFFHSNSGVLIRQDLGYYMWLI